MARSLNRVQLIGNLTRDPELRYTPSGAAVCSFSLATNRSWTTETGEKHEETEFHRIVSWNKLAELCSQFLVKGRKVYVEGRLTTRNWTTQEGQPRTTTEIVIDDMILLDSRGGGTAGAGAGGSTGQAGGQTGGSEDNESHQPESSTKTTTTARAKKTKTEEKGDKAEGEDEIAPDDIPF